MMVVSFACPCGYRDEVREPCPQRIDCAGCKTVLGMARWAPPCPPPAGAGRDWPINLEARAA